MGIGPSCRGHMRDLITHSDPTPLPNMSFARYTKAIVNEEEVDSLVETFRKTSTSAATQETLTPSKKGSNYRTAPINGITRPTHACTRTDRVTLDIVVLGCSDAPLSGPYSTSVAPLKQIVQKLNAPMPRSPSSEVTEAHCLEHERNCLENSSSVPTSASFPSSLSSFPFSSAQAAPSSFAGVSPTAGDTIPARLILMPSPSSSEAIPLWRQMEPLLEALERHGSAEMEQEDDDTEDEDHEAGRGKGKPLAGPRQCHPGSISDGRTCRKNVLPPAPTLIKQVGREGV